MPLISLNQSATVGCNAIYEVAMVVYFNVGLVVFGFLFALVGITTLFL